MKKHATTIILILVFVIGLSVLLYPSVSSYVNAQRQSRAIARYDEQVAKLDQGSYDALFEAAHAYNEALLHKENRYDLTDGELAQYQAVLSVEGSPGGMMGYLDIPAIGVRLPLYHGTSEGVLQQGVGHFEGTSLPVGGESTHAVVSGHRGLPSSMLLTELDRVEIGDVFSFTVYNEVLSYEVDQILDMVEPDDLSALAIEPGADRATLFTCTPYGINSHRLLVRGHRIEGEVPEEMLKVRVSGDARRLETAVVAPMFAVPVLLVVLVWALVRSKRKRERG